MASWKKYFSAVPTQARLQQKLAIQNSDGGVAGHGSSVKYNSYLPEVYSGAPNRVERYIQYEQMDLDSEISKALDTISDFSTQNYEIDDEPFTFNFKGKLTETEITLLKESLSQWCSLNKWQQRLWRLFRNTIKYGDQVFVRDPETFKLVWMDPTKIEKLIVNESKGKDIEQYVIKDIDLNLSTLVGTNMLVHDQYAFPGGYPRSSNPAAGAGTVNYGLASSPGSRNSRFDNMPNQSAVNAEHVLHLSLSEGLDSQWPFGTSILESIYKVYKQKDLLEDAILIYRIVRAPERRVFYIDVGSLSGPRAMQYVERIKNEIYQRRIPNRCISLETKIYLLDGRLLALHDIIKEHSSGKQNWVYSCNPNTGEIVPGKITWAGETRKQAKVVKLTLDSGESIIVTPDHKFPILGKGDIEAQNLKIGESFIPAYFDKHHINKNNNDEIYTYNRVFDNKLKTWKFVHRLVARYFKNHSNNIMCNEFNYSDEYLHKEKNTIHHVDFNRYNNSPENLVWMNKTDHVLYHSNNVEKINYDVTLLNMLQNHITSLSNDKTISLNGIAKELTYNAKFMQHYQNINSHVINKHKLLKITKKKLLILVQRHGYTTWTDYRNFIINSNIKTRNFTEYQFSDSLLKIFHNMYKNSKNSTLQKIIVKLNNDSEFVNEFNLIHVDSRVNKEYSICYAYISAMLENFGYKNFRDYRKKHSNKQYLVTRKNHRELYTFTPHMFNIFKKYYDKRLKNMRYTQKNVGFTHLYQDVQQDIDFKNEFITANATFNKKKFGPDLFRTMLETFGFEDYRDFTKKYEFLNHKLVSIEWLDKLVDTGTITVDGNEEFHNYHNFAIEGGIFTKNSGGGQSVIDAAYNPIAVNEDFYLATNAEGKGTRIETLPGGENLGSIDDLKYFNNKMIRGLGVPSSYLPTGADDGTAQYSDGKVGTAYIQEYRFSKYCQRLQNLMAPALDKEFKMFLKYRGIEIQSNLFELQFFPPQSFSQYRQIQVDTEQIQVFSGLMSTEAARYISKRFSLERYLGWTEDEILKNEHMWKEENTKRVKDKTGAATSPEETLGLGGVGIHSDVGGGFDNFGDLGGPPGPEGSEPETSPQQSQAPTQAAGGPANNVGGAAPPAAGGEAT